MTDIAGWTALFEKWGGRILQDPGWRFFVEEDAAVELPCTINLDMSRYEYREAHFTIRPGAVPDERIACHEIVHVALASLSWPATLALGNVVDGVGYAVADAWLTNAEEITTDNLSRAFVAAYADEVSTVPM